MSFNAYLILILGITSSVMSLETEIIECSAYSSQDADDFWYEYSFAFPYNSFSIFIHRDAISRCPTCTGFEKCGYCLSTLQCVEGNAGGPLDKSPCPSWSYASEGCPGIYLSMY